EVGGHRAAENLTARSRRRAWRVERPPLASTDAIILRVETRIHPGGLMLWRHCSLALLSTSLAVAQTFVVDASNGPGTNFTDVAAAVAAVPDGATLLVRPGSYASFTLNGKGLTILGGPGVQFAGQSAVVMNTLSNQAVVLRGLAFADGVFGPSPYAVTVDACAGAVLIEDCNHSHPPGMLWASSLLVRDSPQVLVRGGSNRAFALVRATV